MKGLISGNRIYLSRLSINDVSEKYAQWLNDIDINRFLESRFSANSIETIRDFVQRMEMSNDSVLTGIFTINDHNHIGNIKLGGINWVHRYGDIGLLIGEKEYWGQGYGSEAIKLIADYAFNCLNLHKVWAGCYVNNVGSVNAFRKAGFYEEACIKKQYFYQGEYIDGITLAKFQEQG